MGELKEIEERIKNIIVENEVNLFYVFCEALLNQIDEFGEEKIMQKYNITYEDISNIKIYVNSIKIGELSNDTFKNVELDKITYTDDIQLLEVMQNQ